jgi:hypothetical protein
MTAITLPRWQDLANNVTGKNLFIDDEDDYTPDSSKGPGPNA